METKWCNKCKKEKATSEFSPGCSWCKNCSAAHSREYGKNHKEEIRVKKRTYRQLHLAEIRENAAQYQRTHKEELAAHNKQYRLAHKEELKTKAKAVNAANRETRAQRRRSRYLAHPEMFLLHRAAARARQGGIPFSLTPSDLLPLPLQCPILNIPLQVGLGRSDPHSYSLDRIVPSLGYVRGNVAVISQRANQIKNDGTIKEHQKIIDWMRRHGQD